MTAHSVANAQSPDSTQSQTINVAPETVVIADTTAPPPVSSSSSGSYSGGGATETIRIYSGSQSGNNLVRTIEVPRPVEGEKRNPY